DSKSQSVDINTGRIENFSSIQDKRLYSENFVVDGNKWTRALISHELILKSDSDKLKTEEADCVKAVIHNQETKETEPIGITTLSPTQPSSQIVAIELEEPTEEDMNTFFTSFRAPT
ncbi:hypothetical protein Gorai_006516, partial [Gossypium raimondii]|nr:hypothetical protein [Gossypium raimondii]